MTWKRALLALVILGLVAGAAAGVYGARIWRSLHEPFPAAGSEPVVVEIEPGTGGSAILARLEERGVLESSRWSRLYLIHVLDDPPLQAGEYRFEPPMSVPEVLQQLIDGRVVTYPVTLIEGLTLTETAQELARQGFGEEGVFLELMSDPSLIADLDPEATNLEGYLHPETYHFSKGTSEAEVVRTLVRGFRDRFDAEVRPLWEAREDSPLESIRDLVKLASIVEKEARLEEERPVIASVYTNRLNIGMGLYADPTIIYALKLAGTWDGNIRRKDLTLDSPYNTYVVPGLPPTPIGSPGLRSLIATAQPEDGPYLYFVSRNDGSHVFSETLAEHNRNVNIWQKQYWQRRWAEERAARGR